MPWDAKPMTTSGTNLESCPSSREPTKCKLTEVRALVKEAGPVRRWFFVTLLLGVFIPLSLAQAVPSQQMPAAANAAGATVVKLPNFTSCTVAELQLAVPELKGLKKASTQKKLAALLDKVGARMSDIARNTPNLISKESVTEGFLGTTNTRHEYDYLILTRREGSVADFKEFRVDVKTGARFQIDEELKNEPPTWTDVERARDELAASQSRPPASQGFATSWLHFYPDNRQQATFRYLGEQKLDGQRVLVLAFAQKPQSVLSPGIFQSHGKTVPMFFQGVSWIDPSDFRIVRMRMDLLAPLPEVSVERLTADIQFAPTRIEQVPALLSLPSEITITSKVGGWTLREIHKYSEYRLFRVQSRIVVDP